LDHFSIARDVCLTLVKHSNNVTSFTYSGWVHDFSVWPIRSGRFGLSRFGLSHFGLADSVWPIPENLGVAKIFDFRRITLFCLEKRLSKHKITLFSKIWGWLGPFGPPGYVYGRFGLAVSLTGHFGRDISVQKELMKFVNLAQVTSAQFGQTVLLSKLKIS